MTISGCGASCIMLLNISAVSVAKPVTSEPSLPPTHTESNRRVPCSICMCLLPGQVRQVYCGVVPGRNNHPPPVCWSLGVAICGFTVAFRDVPVFFSSFPQNPCLCISFPTLVPAPTLCLCPCVSLPSSLPPFLSPNYADKQPGAMAAEEVTCGIFSGVLLAMPAVSLWGWGGVGVSVWCHYLLVICAVTEWNHVNFDTVFHVGHTIKNVGTRVRQICGYHSRFCLMVRGKENSLTFFFFFLRSESVCYLLQFLQTTLQMICSKRILVRHGGT